ncbi:MAG: LytTR family transcriptional regulator [Clostridiales bacterium]|nr:LytTR family transcriptional regulator [Clostridiales bacterium]
MKKENEKSYVWKFKGERLILKGREIWYLHTEQRKLFVHTRRHVYQIGGSLKEAAEKLCGLRMMRPHNAYLVQLDYLETINAHQAVLKNGVTLPVSAHGWKRARNLLEQNSEK